MEYGQQRVSFLQFVESSAPSWNRTRHFQYASSDSGSLSKDSTVIWNSALAKLSFALLDLRPDSTRQ
jgi:hypothetical protein